MITSLETFSQGRPWPPADGDEKNRIAEHAKNRKLYNELLTEIFPKYAAYLGDKQFDDKKIEIILGLAGVATDNYMDLLLGEDPEIEAPVLYDCPHEEVFIDDSRYGIGLYEISEDGINVLSPENVYLVTDVGNIRKVTAYVAFAEFKQGEKSFVKFTIHEPGSISHKVYAITDGKLGEKQDLAAFPDFAGITLSNPEEGQQDTGVDELLIVRVNNSISSERYYGRSDYTPSVHSLIEALVLSFARRSEVLAKFSRPVPMVPESAMRFDHSKQRWVFKTENAIIMKEGTQNAAYLTWDAALGSVDKEIEDLMSQILIKLKISKVLLAGENEGQAESGTALRIRLIPTLSKVRKFASALLECVPRVLSLKSKLDVALQLPDAIAFEPEDVKIALQDGIPSDPMEEAQIGLVRAQSIATLKTAGVLDNKAAMRIAISYGILTHEMLAPSEDTELEAVISQVSEDSIQQGGF
jgi:hypothetical protein